MSDLRYALRSLGRSPVFTIVAILSLALGAGANTAIFSLIDSVMLKMLPIDHPGELFFVSTKPVEAGGVRISINISNAAVKRMQQSAPETAIAYSYDDKAPVSVNGQSESASVHFVSANYFSTLGVRAMMGRTLGPDDDRPDAHVVVLDFAYWRRRFGADPGVLGRAIVIHDVPFTIVGVTPREFYGLSADSPAELMVSYATFPQVESGLPVPLSPVMPTPPSSRQFCGRPSSKTPVPIRHPIVSRPYRKSPSNSSPPLKASTAFAIVSPIP